MRFSRPVREQTNAFRRASMKQATRSNKGEGPLFTANDHLRAQMQIEQRAYELWRARGCRQDGALDNWLQAEGEVLEEFIRAYRNRQRTLSIPGN